MKKLIFILLLFMPMIVYADVGLSVITKYDVVVTNVNGANFYDYDGNFIEVIPYGTTITVFYDYYDNDILILDVEYNGNEGEIYFDDVTIVEKETDEEPQNRRLTSRSNLIFYVVGSIILGITMLVMIVLINKKKKVSDL